MRKDDCWYIEVCGQDDCSNCIRYTEMKFLLDNSGIPKDKQKSIKLLPPDEDYDSYVALASIKDSIVGFVENGDNLYICSKNTGNGKTSWSIKLLLRYFNEIWAGNGLQVRGLYVNVPTLLLRLKNFNNPLSEEYKDNLMNCDLVVWDDIASGRITDYDATQLLSFIDYRISEGKANIYTGNITTEKGMTESIANPRITSRLWNNSKRIIFKAKDRRGMEVSK